MISVLADLFYFFFMKGRCLLIFSWFFDYIKNLFSINNVRPDPLSSPAGLSSRFLFYFILYSWIVFPISVLFYFVHSYRVLINVIILTIYIYIYIYIFLIKVEIIFSFGHLYRSLMRNKTQTTPAVSVSVSQMSRSCSLILS